MNDEKKKLAIVGCLVAVMACVGAFQLLGGKKAAAPPPAAVSETTKTVVATSAAPGKKGQPPAAADAPAPPVNPQVANDLPVRDPFKAPPGAVATAPGPGPVPFQRHDRPAPMSGYRPVHPQLGGLVGGNLPPSTGGPGLRPMGDEHPFGYHLVGEIGGDRPAALFEDAAGNQKLVGVGSAIDGDAKLVSIEREAVIVKLRGGKTLRISMGGTPVGK